MIPIDQLLNPEEHMLTDSTSSDDEHNDEYGDQDDTNLEDFFKDNLV